MVARIYRLIPSASFLLSEGSAWLYYIGKLRSLVDIGDTSTSRKRFSCTGRERNPLVIGITSSRALCTSDLVCVNGTRRTEGGQLFSCSQPSRARARNVLATALPIENVQSAISGRGHEFYYKAHEREKERGRKRESTSELHFRMSNERNSAWRTRILDGYPDFALKIFFYFALIRSVIRSRISYAPNNLQDL